MLPYYQFTAYNIGPLTFQVWGTFVALGIAVALCLGYKEIQRRGLSADHFLSLALWVIVAALITSRIFYVVLFWEEFSGSPFEVFELWNGGMVAYGGIVGALVALYFYSRHYKLDALAYLDVVALVFPVGYAIGRIGCHLIRDHMGKLTDVPWGFVLSSGEVRHDTAVYSILVGIALFVIIWPRRKRINIAGTATLITALLYAASRFIIDIFRAQDIVGSDPRLYGFTVSQYISLAAVLVCGFFLLKNMKPRIAAKNRKN